MGAALLPFLGSGELDDDDVLAFPILSASSSLFQMFCLPGIPLSDFYFQSSAILFGETCVGVKELKANCRAPKSPSSDFSTRSLPTTPIFYLSQNVSVAPTVAAAAAAKEKKSTPFLPHFWWLGGEGEEEGEERERGKKAQFNLSGQIAPASNMTSVFLPQPSLTLLSPSYQIIIKSSFSLSELWDGQKKRRRGGGGGKNY